MNWEHIEDSSAVYTQEMSMHDHEATHLCPLSDVIL
jgi:hypothetical protein